jgi:hypothetical protein
MPVSKAWGMDDPVARHIDRLERYERSSGSLRREIDI